MNIFLCPDSFKESLSSQEVCEALSLGLSAKHPEASITACPMADGGEGSLDCLATNFQGSFVETPSEDALGRAIPSRYLLSADKNTAIIEIANCSGLQQISLDDRDLMESSSYGSGLQMKHALEQGAKEIIFMLGGSATNDIGCGILQALGVEFFTDGKSVFPTPTFLPEIDQMDFSAVEKYKDISVVVACDVTNPLLGTNGATYTFGPQKGANELMLPFLESGIANVKSIVEKYFNTDLDAPGCGAAGGIAAGLVGCFQAQLKSGFDVIAEQVQLEDKIQQADLVISGEGKVDSQSLDGKLVSRLDELCQTYKKPLVLVCGALESEDLLAKLPSVSECISLASIAQSQEQAMTDAFSLLQKVPQYMNSQAER